jgi:hypothetical protein
LKCRLEPQAGTRGGPVREKFLTHAQAVGCLFLDSVPPLLFGAINHYYCSGPLKSEVVELSLRVVDVEINDDFTGPDL